MSTQVPSNFQPYVTQASQGTGVPSDVVAAQANEESGFNASAVSGAGAEGWLQFEPTTYNAYAPQAGVNSGTEFNVADETKVYVVYMNNLLQQEGGSVYKALEAYNAGPGNLPAGAQYANTILQNAGEPQTITASTPASTTGIHWSVNPSLPFPFNLVPLPSGTGGVTIDPYSGIAQGIAGGIGQSILSSLGITSTKDLWQRLGLILLGVALLFLGIHMLGQTSGSSNITVNTSENQDTGQTTRTRTVKTPVYRNSRKTVTGGAAAGTGLKTGASEAVEAAAIA